MRFFMFIFRKLRINVFYKIMVAERNNFSSNAKNFFYNFHVFTKLHFYKFINRMNGSYEMIWKLNYGN